MKELKGIIILLSAAALLTVGLGCGEKKASSPQIGSVLRLSIRSEHGIPSKRGVLLAVDEFNKAGGLNGKKVEVTFEDEKTPPLPR